jgi:uncharacterized membrane protein YccC
MRVTQELLYDSEATLRLVDRVLDDLDMSDHFRSAAGAPGYRTEQLRADAAGPSEPSGGFLRAYWELQDALEVLRESHSALRPEEEGAAERARDDEHDRLNRALSMVDQLQSENEDPCRDPAHDALRGELLALAEHLRCRDAVTDRLHQTADVLSDLERRLAQLSRVFDVAPPSAFS